MGSLSIQPPSGIVRNLTDVFYFLRNDAQKNEITIRSNGDDDKLGLINFDDSKKILFGSMVSPPWVNILDETNYEFTRIRTRIATLKSLQQKHLIVDFSGEGSSDNEKIEEFRNEIMKMFSQCRRLIRSLEESELGKYQAYNKLRQNIVASLLLTLNSCITNFRESQSSYLKDMDSRTHINSFLLASEHNDPIQTTNGINWEDETSELTIDQIQQIIQNEHMTNEREKEVLKISKSILDLNTMFKDIASLILDQGTILDRIDYNVEQSAIRVKSAAQNVESAERYQRNKKMHLIAILAGIAILLTILILLTKF